MIEIGILVALWIYVGKILRAKGHKPLGYQVGVVLAYYSGCFATGFVYGFAAAINGRSDVELTPLFAIMAIIIGSLSAGLVIVVAKCVPAARGPRESASDEFSATPIPYARPSSTNPYASPPQAAG